MSVYKGKPGAYIRLPSETCTFLRGNRLQSATVAFITGSLVLTFVSLSYLTCWDHTSPESVSMPSILPVTFEGLPKSSGMPSVVASLPSGGFPEADLSTDPSMKIDMGEAVSLSDAAIDTEDTKPQPQILESPIDLEVHESSSQTETPPPTDTPGVEQATPLPYISIRPNVDDLLAVDDETIPSERFPTFFPELFNARWMGDWVIPDIKLPVSFTGNATSSATVSLDQSSMDPVFLMLHIFSTDSESSFKKRQLIRELDIRKFLPIGWKNLVEIKFVIGVSQTTAQSWEGQDMDINAEMEMYRDLVLLDNLAAGGENMNEGKSWDWIRFVGQPGRREAQWVFKCDDDTLTILPNLIRLLQDLDPKTPTYVGTTLRRNWWYPYYLEGGLYGMSWGIVKTIASADVSSEARRKSLPEDVRMGGLMFSLPSRPELKQPYVRPDLSASLMPTSPDARTSLVRIDVVERIGPHFDERVPAARTAIGLHFLKSGDEFRKAFDDACGYFIGDDE